MKRVSFETAKYLKDVGYPQYQSEYLYVTKEIDEFDEGELVDKFYSTWAGDNVIDAPYAMEVWLWLWREKGFYIKDTYDGAVWVWSDKIKSPIYIEVQTKDPEEAIEKAIEYLVDNDLIK